MQRLISQSRKLLFLFIFYINILTILGQNYIDHNKAHRKYWYYRTRLINDFTKLGTNQGESIIFAQRNYDYEDYDLEFANVGPDQIDLINMYLMTLALEYKILSRNNQDVKETLSEIYYLLYTINRLDLEAEQFWDNSPPITGGSDAINANGVLNGFMLREDLQENFILNNNKHFNYGTTILNPNNKSFTGLDFIDRTTTENKFNGYFKNSQPKHQMVLPHDKYHTMILAMMFIQKYIPGGEMYKDDLGNPMPFQDGATDIKGAAKNIANRAYNYCKGIGITNGTWKLHYINSSNNPVGIIANPDGGDAWLYSWPISKMTCHVNHGFPFSQNNSGCANYIDVNTLTIGYQNYRTMCFTPNPCFGEDNAVFKMWDQAGSNSDPSPLFPVYVTMQANASANNLEWGELLRKVLHQDGILTRQLGVYGDPINYAPCNGPYNFGNCIHGGWQWSSQDRTEHPEKRGANCDTEPHEPIPCIPSTHHGGFYGNYPGIDYMLLHNLYYEYQNQISDGNNGNTSFGLGNTIVTTIVNALTGVSSAIQASGCTVGNVISNMFNSGSSCNLNNIIGNGTNQIFPYKDAYNLMDNFDQNIWPRDLNVVNTTFTQGNNNFPAKVSVFQNLKSNSRIYALSSPTSPNNTIPSNVVYRAGKEITLLPGFEVNFGSNFHAYVLQYLCSNNNDPLTMRTSNDSTALDSSNYINEIFNLLPIHYSSSPPSDSDLNPASTEDSSSASLRENNNYELFQELLNTKDPVISTNKDLDLIKIIPNPNNGKFRLYTFNNSVNQKLNCKIIDMLGVKIFDFYISEELTEIDLAGYKKGIYNIVITNDFSQYTETKRVIIQ